MNAKDGYTIECDGLCRTYKSGSLFGDKRETVALAELTLRVPQGIVFGLLGPNGAGKTTTVRILSTLLTPTAGRARVYGADVVRDAGQVRKHIGLILGGDRGFFGRLTAKQNLAYFAALNHMSPSVASRRSDELLGELGLNDSANTPVEQFSRGMKQRLHIARALLTDPRVLFMDEPTIGLDPFGAQQVRQMIPQLVSRGKTVFLTTHYMFEADQLCNTIALINKGRLVAEGSPTDIKRKFSKINVVELTLKDARESLRQDIARIEEVERVEMAWDGVFPKLVIQVKSGIDLRDSLITIAGEDNVQSSLARDPTLEEAYLTILR